MDSQRKPSLVLTEEAYITTNAYMLKRRMIQAGLNPDEPFEVKHEVIGNQLCVIISEKEPEKS